MSRAQWKKRRDDAMLPLKMGVEVGDDGDIFITSLAETLRVFRELPRFQDTETLPDLLRAANAPEWLIKRILPLLDKILRPASYGNGIVSPERAREASQYVKAIAEFLTTIKPEEG